MKKFKKSSLVAAIILIFCSLAPNIISEGSSIESEILQLINERNEAFEKEDYKKCWKQYAKLLQQKWGDFEEFRKWCFKNADLIRKKVDFVREIYGVNIKIRPITTKRCIAVSPPDVSFISPANSEKEIFLSYLVKENGEWKIADPEVYTNKAEDDMGLLADRLDDYHSKNGRFPDELSQLVPIYISELPPDPFNDEDKTYVYVSTGDICEFYSYGPDSDDDLGLVEYNSELGFVSDGDIILRK